MGMRRSNMARSCMGVYTCVECKFVFVVILIDYLLFIDSRFTTFSKAKFNSCKAVARQSGKILKEKYASLCSKLYRQVQQVGCF